MVRREALGAIMCASSVLLFLVGQISPASGQMQSGVQVGPDLSAPFEGPRPAATAGSINFDDQAAPCGFGAAIPLRFEYAVQGVVFSGPGVNDGGAVLDECGSFGVSGHSPPNFLAFNLQATLANGGIPRGPETLTFFEPASEVTINAGQMEAVTITMECFDETGSSVGSQTIVSSNDLQPLTVSGRSIHSCVLSFPGNVAVFDDLQFQSFGDVPALSSNLLPILALLLLAISTAVLLPKCWATKPLLAAGESRSAVLPRRRPAKPETAGREMNNRQRVEKRDD